MEDLIWEHELGNSGNTDGETYAWKEVNIGMPDPSPLNGFYVKMRPKYNLSTGPQAGPQYVWPSWEITSQKIEISKPDCGTKVYASKPKGYQGGLFYPGPFSDPAGIVDGSGYVYVRTFDQTEFYYLEAFSGDGVIKPFTGEIRVTDNFPYEPYDPDKNIYPMDAITRFKPDERETVTITYTVETKFKIKDIILPPPIIPPPLALITTGVHTISITQVVRQEHHNDWRPQLNALMERTFFYHGIYH